MDRMTSYLARKGAKLQEQEKLEEQKKNLKTYIVHKRKALKGIIYRTQNRYLRPFYFAGTIKIEYIDKATVLKEIYTQFGDGEYIVLYFPASSNRFKLYWKGRLPYEKQITNKDYKDDD
jgi:hypothetical protein